ncbi:MAG TPA: hypothetical protein VEH09_09160 [Thermodesulfobacteriota bacterium]|nr:hypothetical protein [Thermodesulfobacteriota bacterium]
MKTGERAFAIVLIWAGLLWVPWAEEAFGQTTFQAYTKPQVAPLFMLENLQGKRVDMRDHRGQVTVLNFWSTW